MIGLSIAYELAAHDLTVALLDKSKIGKEASWAGAGILPPTNIETATDPIDQLRAISGQLHPEWSRSLLEETEIDNGFWNCGAVYVGRSAGEVSSIAGSRLNWSEEKIPFECLSTEQLAKLVPALENQLQSIESAVFLPGESQISNRDHLRALELACRQRGVDFFEEIEIQECEFHSDRLSVLRTVAGPFAASHFCATSGAWTGQLLKKFDIEISVLPVRGQMLAFKLPEALFSTIINDGSRYLVPRRDGWVLAGSTLEHAGFDKKMTSEGQRSLFHFANGLIEELNEKTLRDRWAGLRPATFDGFPYIGCCPKLTNVVVATGHFRIGLQTSTGTAQIVRELVEGKTPKIDVEPFRVGRG